MSVRLNCCHWQLWRLSQLSSGQTFQPRHKTNQSSKSATALSVTIRDRANIGIKGLSCLSWNTTSTTVIPPNPVIFIALSWMVLPVVRVQSSAKQKQCGHLPEQPIAKMMPATKTIIRLKQSHLLKTRTGQSSVRLPILIQLERVRWKSLSEALFAETLRKRRTRAKMDELLSLTR